MEIQNDFRDLLALFNSHEVEYLIVGGYALAYLGHPRTTGDIDLYVQPTPENARRIMAALTDFGFGAVGLEAADFELPGKVAQLGFPPVRIDIVTSITGVDWQAARAGRVAATYGGVPVYHIGREQFIANKRATGRKKDLGDLESLGTQ